MRRHGWQLPYHPLQIVAVAVFSALAFSFYVFFVPFLGSDVLKFHVLAGFSPVVFAVVTLYVRCAAIDPADSGIRNAKRRATRNPEVLGDITMQGRPRTSLEEEVSRNFQIFQAPGEGVWEVRVGKLCRCLCLPAVLVWRCIPGSGTLKSLFCEKPSEPEKYIPDEDLLFCGLCEAEILKHSKHCRACDKCVDGFDHHCRWLNNCVGKKNYKSFVAVMVASLLMLVTQWCIGVFVLVRCFREKHAFDLEIVDRLGSGFSRVPFVVVVTLCTFLAILATLPLTQLLFFHLILIRKGITTYDYIVAMREQDNRDEPSETFLARSVSSSPASSVATAVSNSSSLGALQRAVWCTPPRLFVENQAQMKSEVVVQYATSFRGASLKVPSLVELEMGNTSKPVKPGLPPQQKRSVGLSPWKLARLSSKDASKAGVRARENSSILRPVKYIGSSAFVQSDESSYENSAEIATTSSGHRVGWRVEKNPLALSGQVLGPGHDVFRTNETTEEADCRETIEVKSDRALVPLQLEGPSSFRSRSCSNVTALAAPLSVPASPDNFGSPDAEFSDAQFYSNAIEGRPRLYRATSDGYEASGGESGDDTSDHGRRLSQAWSKLKLNPSFLSKADDVHSASIKWRSGLEDLAASWASASQAGSRTSSWSRSNTSRAEANILKYVKNDWPSIRNKVSTPTEESNNSSPSHYESPSQRMSPDLQSVSDPISSEQPEALESSHIILTPEESPKSFVGKRSFTSAKRLKESILSYKKGLSPSATNAEPAVHPSGS